MKRSDFTYDLPEELIAQQPARQRSGSRLLVLHEGRNFDAQFNDLPSWLRADDVLVFNDTRVIKARTHARKATGGRVEILVEQVLDAQSAWCLLKSSKPCPVGAVLELGDGRTANVRERGDGRSLLQFDTGQPLLDWLDRMGEVPLPPYIHRDEVDHSDADRYQTVYGVRPGAVAAPTAGLHFDQPMLARIDAMGVTRVQVTLHVGAGTFQPVRADDIREHHMHSEWVSVSAETAHVLRVAREEGRRIVAVGTTSVRAIETAALANGGTIAAYEGFTDIFLYPGKPFHVTDALLTNFHLPESTLLMLVSALAGRDRILDAYRHAVRERYRFFSYGDAMLILDRWQQGECV